MGLTGMSGVAILRLESGRPLAADDNWRDISSSAGQSEADRTLQDFFRTFYYFLLPSNFASIHQ
jgi:hypothetical protein